MKKKGHILIIEDDAILLEQLSGALKDEGFRITGKRSAEEADDILGSRNFHLVITDLRLPGSDGLEVIRRAQERNTNCPVLIITAHASVDTAVEAMKLGAFHYLQKPITLDTLLVEVQRALGHGCVLRDRQALKERLSSEQGLGRITGESRTVVQMREMIRNIAPTDSTVLITGETGTGKELVANALHYESERASGPLVKVNCAALSETLLESELFGHEKGAFTGAEKRRAGRFERADGGTLFLDEISEMGIHVQAKLLRVLQGDELERVGGEESIPVDVRVVAATNREPLEAIEEGKLRNDLYYRLNIMRIHVPPLRERSEDMELLAKTFLSNFSAKYGKNIISISEKVLDDLSKYDWPGNIRELENCIERAVLLAKGEELADVVLSPDASGGVIHVPGSMGSATLNLQELEKHTILRALDESDWNKTRAAEKLGIYPSSLYKKMKRFNISFKQRQ
ncbi:MAG: sigma-54-dependent transcriptional regulator [Planctomycetota bacterium]